jgi:tetratricopeptide (TPR) repeat protein
LTAHFRTTRSSARARAATGFGLAKAYDDIGDREAAARVLREANALVRSQQTWSAANWRDFVARRKQEQPARARSPVTAEFVPVFVVGLPRTGTTLTATHLAKHAGARDRGELRTLRFIARQLIDGGHLHDASAIEEAAALYLAHARQDDAPATWYIDQDPLNFRYLHLIAAMFPQARIVLCQRGRRDTALSLWSQDFAHEDCAFAYDFADIENFMAGHDALLEHWQRTLPLPIHSANYEDLVADPQRALAELRNFTGILETQATTSDAAVPINSASVWQARQPIYTRSVGRWRAYAPFIPELMQFPAGD